MKILTILGIVFIMYDLMRTHEYNTEQRARENRLK